MRHGAEVNIAGKSPAKKTRMKKDGKKMKEEKSAFERIYDIIREIPEGKVASYGQVAELAGNRRWARVVGLSLIHISIWRGSDAWMRHSSVSDQI